MNDQWNSFTIREDSYTFFPDLSTLGSNRCTEPSTWTLLKPYGAQSQTEWIDTRMSVSGKNEDGISLIWKPSVSKSSMTISAYIVDTGEPMGKLGICLYMLSLKTKGVFSKSLSKFMIESCPLVSKLFGFVPILPFNMLKKVVDLHRWRFRWRPVTFFYTYDYYPIPMTIVQLHILCTLLFHLAHNKFLNLKLPLMLRLVSVLIFVPQDWMKLSIVKDLFIKSFIFWYFQCRKFR